MAAPETASESLSSNASDDQRNIFPFFDLPRELRDIIYADALIDRTLEFKDAGRSALELKATSVPAVHLLVINRQFNDEYQTEASRHGHLIILDRNYTWTLIENLQLPPMPFVVTDVAINIAVTSHPDELGMHQHFVKRVLPALSGVRTINLRIDLLTCRWLVGETADALQALENGDFWRRIPRLASLKVFDCKIAEEVGPGDADTIAFRFGERLPLLAEYSPKRDETEKVNQQGTEKAQE